MIHAEYLPLLGREFTSGISFSRRRSHLTLKVTCTHQYTLQCTQTKVVVGLRRELFLAQLEEGHNLSCQHLCSFETLFAKKIKNKK
jgi:hypothetical protein